VTGAVDDSRQPQGVGVASPEAMAPSRGERVRAAPRLLVDHPSPGSLRPRCEQRSWSCRSVRSARGEAAPSSDGGGARLRGRRRDQMQRSGSDRHGRGLASGLPVGRRRAARRRSALRLRAPADDHGVRHLRAPGNRRQLTDRSGSLCPRGATSFGPDLPTAGAMWGPWSTCGRGRPHGSTSRRSAWRRAADARRSASGARPGDRASPSCSERRRRVPPPSLHGAGGRRGGPRP